MNDIEPKRTIEVKLTAGELSTIEWALALGIARGYDQMSHRNGTPTDIRELREKILDAFSEAGWAE